MKEINSWTVTRGFKMKEGFKWYNKSTRSNAVKEVKGQKPSSKPHMPLSTPSTVMHINKPVEKVYDIVL